MRLRLPDAPAASFHEHVTKVIDLTSRRPATTGPVRERPHPATVTPLFRSTAPTPGPAA